MKYYETTHITKKKDTKQIQQNVDYRLHFLMVTPVLKLSDH